MGRRGPPPQPTALRVARGNPGHRPLNHAEPEVRIGLPEPPPYLTALAAEFYPQFGALLLDMRVLTVADGWALGQLCEAYADHVDAKQTVEREGRFVTVATKAGEYRIKHPAMQVMQDADKRFKGWCQEFGLSPSSRSRVKVVTKQADGDEKRKRFFGDRTG